MKKTTKSDELANATFSKMAKKVIDAMESDPGEWVKSWSSQAQQGLPFNAVTGDNYKGGNVLWLLIEGWSESYPTNQWATFRQWKSVGYSVQKGQTSTVGIFFKPVIVEDKEKTDENGNPVKRQFWIKRSFRVFNRAQVAPIEGATLKPLHGDIVETPTHNERIGNAETFFASFDLHLQYGQPAYSPTKDVVYMPAIDSFESSESYYATLAHEATHWTGHESRLNRPKHKRWGDESYAFEELVAELGAMFVTTSVLGLNVEPRPDHARYLASWIKKLKDDPSAIWTAATKAEQATRHMTESQNVTESDKVE